MSKTPFFDATLDYAREGFRVFRITPGRKVGGSRWRHGPASEIATSDLDELARRVERYPASNIGIATGNGLAVLDIDSHHGGERPAWAVPTREARTPNGGLHLYYRTDGHVRNSAGRIATGVDVRGDAGMVLAPPSRTEHGTYSWITDPGEPLAFLPASQFHEFTAATPGSGYQRTTRRKRPEDVRPGEVHDQVLSWGGWLAAQGCDDDEVRDLIWQLVERFPFDVDNANNHIAKALDWVLDKHEQEPALDLTTIGEST